MFGLQMLWCVIPELNSEIPELHSGCKLIFLFEGHFFFCLDAKETKDQA
jgi:hypothetical protein